MKNGIERRRHPRIPLDVPVVVITPQGTIEGKTLNISVGGLALLLFNEKPEIGDEFDVTLKFPLDGDISVTREKLWSEDIIAFDTVYNEFGVRFTKISPTDRKIIADLVSEYSI